MYINDYECVSSCPEEGKIYADENRICTEQCPDNKNYVIKEFTHHEEDTQKKCLSSCPLDYPYYKEETIGDIIFKFCIGVCNYYVMPENENIKSIKCYDDLNKCPDTHKYFIKYENGTNQCLTSCPSDIPFYYGNEEGFKQCYKTCPDTAPYHEHNSFECKDECSTNTIDYETKECVIDCSNSQLWSKDESKPDIKYCLKKCNSELGEFLSVDNECVKTCDNEQNLVNDMSDPMNKKCKCKNLFYIDNNKKTKCLDSDITECSYITGADYKYRIYDSNQCTNYCFDYLSPSEDICYSNISNCEEIEQNTYLTITENNQLKCSCKYIHYKYNGKTICLGENEDCSTTNYYFYYPKNKECLMDCGLLKYFDNICLDGSCEDNFLAQDSANGQKCTCAHNWHKEVEKIICDNSCPPSHPYLIEDTKECVKKCRGTNHEVFYKNQCLSNCEERMVKIGQEDEKLLEIAPYTCQCLNIWYKHNDEVECISDDSKKCSDYDFKYLVKETNECVHSCPEIYPYYFNGECFQTCSDAKQKYQYPIKAKEGSKECTCENLWKRQTDENDENVVINICLKITVCEKLMVNETKECVEECPTESPFNFNNQCYKKGKCPELTIENENEKVCDCENLWHKQFIGENNEEFNKKCVKEKECPITHPYKLFPSNECISTKCETFIVNNTCYEDRCPNGTKSPDNSNDNDAGDVGDDGDGDGDGSNASPDVNQYNCECDPEFGFWHKVGDENPKMICGLTACPNDKQLVISLTKECVKSCSEREMYEYKGMCYKNKCPEPTVSENAKTNKYKCTTKKYANATTVEESFQFVKQEIVDLYQSVPSGGITYKISSSIMQIYGINKTNVDQKSKLIRSTLSYIDISSCSEKVYDNNHMQDSEDIVVVKYDLGNQGKRSLINPVEYEFINSRTGAVLDVSVCTKNDIIVSYSLFDILNYSKKGNKRRLEDNSNIEDTDSIILNIQNQYKKGKEIYNLYQLDTFDINSTIYTDKCFPLEIDGKDLVLEDRVKYLYPYYSLCEENCTYSGIDYEFERIYCNCPLKNEFDLNRQHKFVVNPNNTEQIKANQNGPTNLPVLSCLSKLTSKQSTDRNGGFFYSLIILLVEVGLLFVTIFYNYKLLKNKICKNNLSTDNNEDEKQNETVENEPKRKISNKYKVKEKADEVIYKTSQRALEAPPKKREIINVDSNKDKDNINNINEKFEKNIIANKENISNNNKENDGTETEDPRLDVEDGDSGIFAINYEFGILKEIEKEQELLRIKYETALHQDKSDVFIMLLTEICDKIYLIKIVLLPGKYNMFSIYISLYLLYHLLLLTFITCFYDIKTISKIWNTENFPDLNYDLGYGLLACLIVWVIYRIFLCILNNEKSIKKYLRNHIRKSNTSENTNLRENSKSFNKLLYKIKYGMIVYFVIQFATIIICLLYLTAFCAVFTGTKAKIFKTYGIALVEVLIIKILYGIILGILRKVALVKQIRILYKIVYNFDKYIY